MAKEVLTNPRVFVGSYDLSGDANQLAIDYGADAVEITTFASAPFRDNAGGFRGVAWALEGLWEAENADKALYDTLGLTSTPVSYAVQPGAEGALAYTFACIKTRYAPRGQIGDAFRFSAAGQSRGALVRGRLVASRLATAVDSASPPLQLGALSATQRLICAWHLFGYQGTGTINATVYSDNSVGFGTPTARGSFVGRTAIGAEVIEIAGPITDDYWAFDWSFVGGPPTVSLAAVFGILG